MKLRKEIQLKMHAELAKDISNLKRSGSYKRGDCNKVIEKYRTAFLFLTCNGVDGSGVAEI